jgi:hypothetical protein
MASIYTNSYLTIAATRAADGSRGLLSKRRMEEFRLTFRSDYTNDLVEPEPSLTESDRILGASLYRQAANHLKSGLSWILGPDLVQSNPTRSPSYTPRFFSLHVFARQYLDHGYFSDTAGGKEGKASSGYPLFQRGWCTPLH